MSEKKYLSQLSEIEALIENLLPLAVRREALLRVLSHKIDIGCPHNKLKLWESYHRVKGYEYPALEILCSEKGKRKKKIHINQSESAKIPIQERIVLIEFILQTVKKLLKSKRLTAFVPNIPDEFFKFLKFFEEEFQRNEAVWNALFFKFLKQKEKMLTEFDAKKLFNYKLFNYPNMTIEVVDLEPIKKLKVVVEKREAVRNLKKFFDIPYIGKEDIKEGTNYVLSTEPLKVLKITPREIFLNNQPIFIKNKKEENYFFSILSSLSSP